MRIAVDAMGGDHAPEAIVEGAVQAAEEYGFSITLVGLEDRIKEELAKYRTEHLAIEIRHASQIVDMHDVPSFALRRKKDSSMHRAIYMLRNGEADAAISAGNTGAAMAIGKVACRVLEGVDRPALATVLPNISGISVMVDVGANVDCKPVHLLQFAAMGHVYAQEVFGVQNPRIGLLSIGEEASKGNVLTKEVFDPLSQSGLNFIGNAEGRDVFNGRVDVVVCDGFIGNVVLKVSESLAQTMGLLMKEAFTESWRTKLGYLLVKPGIQRMRKRVDYSEYGGAPLLGLNGVVIVSHGSSKAKAIKNAIRVAAESVNHHLNTHLIDTITQCEFDTKSRAKATSLWRQLKNSIRHENTKEKAEAEKKEEAEPQTQEKESPVSSEEPAQKTEEQESEKKHWWNLKDSKLRENDKGETEPDVVEKEKEKEASSSPAQPESSAESATSESSKEIEREKSRWWKIKGGQESQKDADDGSPEESPETVDAETAPKEHPTTQDDAPPDAEAPLSASEPLTEESGEQKEKLSSSKKKNKKSS